jgi:hypothetical protein
MKRLLLPLVAAAVLAVLAGAVFANKASAGRPAVLDDAPKPLVKKPVDPPAARPQVHGANCRCAICARNRPIVIPGSRFYYVPPQLWGPSGPPPGYYGNNYGTSSYYYRYQYLPGAGIGFGPGAIFNW